MQKFNERTARKNLPDFDEFRNICEDIQGNIVLYDFDEYLQFLDGSMAEALAERFTCDHARTSRHIDHLEVSFLNAMRYVARKHNELFNRREFPSTEKQQRLLMAINKDLHALGADFANLIIGAKELDKPIKSGDLRMKF